MTDKQHETRQDTQKAAGELRGAHDGDEHTEDRTEQAAAAPEHTTGGGEEGKRKEDRKGGERGTRMDGRHTAAGREQRGQRKRVCNIFKGERRGEKHR